MAIAWASAGAGAGTETNGAALNLVAPATVDAGDILIAHVMHTGTATAPSTPGGWSLLRGPENVGATTATARHWVFGKIADGTEDGATISFGTAGGTNGRAGRIHRFTGRVSGTITDLVPSASFSSIPHDSDPQGPTVETTVAGALAIACTCQDDNNTNPTITGESGGSWGENAEYVNATWGPQGITMAIHSTATTPDPGTVSGGAVVAGANDDSGTIGFEIRPSVPAQTISGGVAPSNESASGGTVLQPQVVMGGVASESSAAPVGKVAQVYLGSPVPFELDRVPAALSGVVARSFDVTDDTIVLGPGSLTDIGNGGFSVVAIARPTAAEFGFILSVNSDTEMLVGFGLGGTGLILSLPNGDTRFGFLGATQNEWQLFAVTVADAAQPAPRFHRKALLGGSWAHGDGSILSSGWKNTALATYIRVNGVLDGLSLKAHDQAAFAIWQDTALSDGQIEGMDDNLRTADLLVAGPNVLAELDQPNVTDPVLDLIGNADETSRTGTTVIFDGPWAWRYLQLISASGVPAENDSVPAGSLITLVSGGVGVEADNVPAGTVSQPQLIVGGTAAESDQVLGGSVVQPQAPVSGGVAASSEAASAGQVAQTYTASPATEADAALAGTAIVGGPQTIVGGVAAETDSAPAGAALQAQIVSGGVASESEAAISGKVAQVYPSGTAAESDGALAGVVRQPQPPVLGAAAIESDAAPGGKVTQLYTSAAAGESESVPAGVVLQRVYGGVASESDFVPLGFAGAGQAVSGGIAGSSESVPSGQVLQAIVVVGGIANEADAALAAAILQTLYGGVAPESDAVPGGSVVQPILVLGGVAGELDLVLAGDVGELLASIVGSEIEKWGITGSQNGETMDLSEAAATVTLSERKL